MPSHTIKVTGVSSELLHLLDERIREQHAAGRSDYIRELIRNDVLGAGPGSRGKTFREIVKSVHDAAPADETEAESEEFVSELIGRVRQERRQRFALTETR